MKFETRLWREAAFAPDIEALLERFGADLLAELALEGLAIRSVADRRVDTIGAIRRGRIGVSRPASARAELRDAAASRLRQWVRDGQPEQASAHRASSV